MNPAREDDLIDDLDALAGFLRRLGTLSPLRELELAEMIAPIYGRRLGIAYKDPIRFLALLYARATATLHASRSQHFMRMRPP